MDSSTIILSRNISEVRDSLGLSQKDFSLLCNISSSTLINIESGKKSFEIKTIERIVDFTKLDLDKLSKRDFVPPTDFREKLARLYKNDPEVYVLLTDTPSIPYCVKYKLLNTDFLTSKRERKEILKFIKDNYGWVINGNSLTNALKNMPKTISIEPHPTKYGTNLYSKKLA